MRTQSLVPAGAVVVVLLGLAWRCNVRRQAREATPAGNVPAARSHFIPGMPEVPMQPSGAAPAVVGHAGPTHATGPSFGPMTLYDAVKDWPPSHVVARDAIQNFAQALGLHDAIAMDPESGDEEIVARAVGMGVPEEFVREALPGVFWVTDSLEAHVRRSLINPELRQVHDVVVALGVPVTLGGDLLIDAFRLCSFKSVFGDFMASQANDAVPEGQPILPADIAEMQRCLEVRDHACATVGDFFVRRFHQRHGLPLDMAAAVVEALRDIEVHGASPPTMAVPRVRRP
jgi:hypothetical protein